MAANTGNIGREEPGAGHMSGSDTFWIFIF